MRLVSPYTNKLMTTGYSFCWYFHLLGMYAHTADRATSMYKDQPETAMWFYVPINEGESIIGIWLRKIEHQPSALIVCSL